MEKAHLHFLYSYKTTSLLKVSITTIFYSVVDISFSSAGINIKQIIRINYLGCLKLQGQQ